jgi:xylitol oxidase
VAPGLTAAEPAELTSRNTDEARRGDPGFSGMPVGLGAFGVVTRVTLDIEPSYLLVSEIRAIAADDLWLSGASGRPTLALHFTWRHNARKVVGLLPGLQEALAPFGARPHWGTVWRRFSLNPLYPELTHARDLFERLDPDGTFSNDHLQRIGIRAAREP